MAAMRDVMTGHSPVVDNCGRLPGIVTDSLYDRLPAVRGDADEYLP